AGGDERPGDPGAHLPEDLRPDLRHRPAKPADRDASGVHVVPDLPGQLLRSRGGRGHPAADRRGGVHRPVHLVLAADGAAAMTAVAPKQDAAQRDAPVVSDAGRIRSRWTPWVATARYAILFVLVVFFLLPVYVMLVTSLKDPA